jgi:hypothetical protein
MSDIEIGHNNPPEVLELADGVISDISICMGAMPVVQDEATARIMKVQIDRAKHAIKDLEAELAGKVRPFLAAEEMIREDYRPKRRMLGDLLDEMLARLQIFVSKEQDRREQEAAKLAALAQEARLRALEAERIEMEKLDDASKGEIGVNVAEVIQQADQAFETYEKAERQATVAQKETHVKIGGGFGRAIGMRKVETLKITDWRVAIAGMGLTNGMREEILKMARAYRRVHGKLPEGVISEVDEHL